MAVGFDAATEFPTTQSAGASNTLTLSWNHIPVTSTPRGVGLFVTYAPSSLTEVTAVKYGGVNLTRRAFARDTANEPAVMEFWYLGAGIPTGTQAFNVVRGISGSGMWGAGFTVSASFSTTVPQTIVVQENTSLNERTLSTIGVGVRFAGAYYGGAAPPGTGANSTTLFDIDYGAYAARVVRETTAGSGNRVVGFAAGTADDVAAIYAAVEEEAQVIPATTLSASGLAANDLFGVATLFSRATLSASGLTSSFSTGLAVLTSRAFISATGIASSFSAGLATLSQLETATYTLSATIPAGWKYTTIGTPNTASQYSVAYSSSPTLATGDLVVFQKWARSGGATVSSSITISTDGIVTFSPRSASASLSFQYFFWDDSVSAYGSTLTWLAAPIITLLPTGLSSGFTTGTPALYWQQFISATGLSTSADFGAANLYSKSYLSATGLPSDQTLGAHTVLAGFVYLSASGVSSNFAVGAHTVTSTATTATYTLSVSVPAGWKYTTLIDPNISSTANIAYGQSATVATNDIVLFQEFARKNGVTTSYSITISTDGSVTVFAQSDSSSLSFQYFFWDDSTSDYGTTATFSILEWTVLRPTGLASNAAFGSHIVSPQKVVLSASGLSTFAAIGSHLVLPGDVFISATGLSTSAAFGLHTALVGKVFVNPAGLSSSEAVGSHSIANKFLYLFASGLSSSFSTGLAILQVAGTAINTTGLPTNEAFGQHTLIPGDVILVPSGHYSPELFGTHLLTAAGAVIQPDGLESSLSIGTAVLTSFANIQTTGLASGAAFGQHLLVFTQYISPSGQSYFAIGVARIYEQGEVVALPVQDIFEWLYESGATGGVMKRTKEYLKLQGFTGNTNTALFNWLRSLGYTKSLTSMLDKFERDNTIQHGPE